MIDRFTNNNAVSYAIVSFSHKKQVLTKTGAGLDGFTRDPKALKSALAKLDAAGGVTDYEGAWNSAHHLLSADMSHTHKEDPHLLQHSTYIVLFLADGSPYPQIQSAADWAGLPSALRKEMIGSYSPKQLPKYNVPARILKRVKDVMLLPSIYKAASLRVHSFYLQANAPAWNDASPLLKSIAGAGNGVFRSFPNAEQIDFLAVNYSTQVAWGMDLKNLVVSNQNLRTTKTGAAPDSDGDGLTDAEEKLLGTNAHARDSDMDGWTDAVEQRFKFNPLDPKDADCPLKLFDLDKDGHPDDSDGDGLRDCEERLLGTHARLADTDADGFDDRLELLGQTDPLSSDSWGDLDLDGLSNGAELRSHTLPGSDEGAARKSLSYRYTVKLTNSSTQLCYSYDVDNILLARPPLGANTVVLHAGEALEKTPGDYGTFRAACVRASPGPAPQEVMLPQSAWKRLRDLDLTTDCVTP